jgi:outer membrane protein assembly factor BamD (BamD/ComL family)
MPRREAVLLAALALLTPGCFLTRAVGLGPDLSPDEIADEDPPEVKYGKAERLFARSEWSDAAYAFHRVWVDHPKSDLASDAQFYEADARYGQGKYNGAFELYKRYLKDWPLSPHAPVIQRRIYDMGTYTIEAGKHGFLGIFNYSDEGVDQLDFLVSAFPHGDLADDALVYMADYEWRDRQTHEAIDHLHNLIDDYPLSEWALEGRLRLARAYRDLNRGAKYDADSLQRSAAEYRAYLDLVAADAERAREYAEKLATARTELAEVEEQLARKKVDAADFYLRMGNVNAARAELRNAIRDFPRTQAAAEAREQLGSDESRRRSREVDGSPQPGADAPSGGTK